MFFNVCLVLLLGYPVAFSLAGSALLFAGLGTVTEIVFDSSLLSAVPSRIYGIMTNTTLIAAPLFVFMGVMLEKSRLAEDLLSNMAKAFRTTKRRISICSYYCWHATGSKHRNSRCNSGDNGSNVLANNVKTKL